MSPPSLLRHILWLVVITGIWAAEDDCVGESGGGLTPNETTLVICTATSTLHRESTDSMFTTTSSTLPLSFSLMSSIVTPNLTTSISSVSSVAYFVSTTILPSLTTSKSSTSTIPPLSTAMPSVYQSSSSSAVVATVIESSSVMGTITETFSTMTTKIQSSLTTVTATQSLPFSSVIVSLSSSSIPISTDVISSSSSSSLSSSPSILSSSGVVSVSFSSSLAPVFSSVIVTSSSSSSSIPISSGVTSFSSSSSLAPVSSSVITTTTMTSSLEMTTSDVAVLSRPSSTITFVVSSSFSPSPTTSPDSFFATLSEYLMTPIGLAVVIGGPVIVVLVVVIIVIVCCYFCVCRKSRGRFDIGSEKYSNGNLRYNGQRVSNTDPQDIQMTLKKVQMERHLITQSAGAGFAENGEMDDSLHYQGHSQIQHSQMYSQMQAEGIETPCSLPKLTPMHPSQIISQVQIGQISVDDDDDDENGEDIPVRDKHKCTPRIPIDDDSPFMHLSDNLSRHSSKSRLASELSLTDNLSRHSSKSRLASELNLTDNLSRHSSKSRITSEFSHTPLDQVVSATGTQHSQFQDASQLSYLGLGVRHASDVVMTNTASLLEEDDSTGLSTLGLEKSSTSQLRYSSASPLLSEDNNLDDTPVREKPGAEGKSGPHTSGKPADIARLTSLYTDTDAPVKDAPPDSKGLEEQQELGSSLEATAAKPGKKMSLVAMTSLPSKERLSASVEVASEMQEGPERQRSQTLASTRPSNFSRSSRNTTKLGKLTSLEYIRASLRKRLNTIKSKDGRDKKPLKSALRKTSSVSSTSSNESTPNHQPPPGMTFVNRYTHYDEFGGRDMSPHPLNYPPHMTSPDMMGPLDVPPVGYMGGTVGYMGGAVPYSGREPYGYSGPPQLSPAMGYGHELSPILSVPFDYIDPHQYSRHEIGILPPYGGPMPMMGEQFPIPISSQYDDDDLPYRHGGPGPSQGQSQRVTWNLDHEEIPPRTPVDPEELTPSDIDDHEIA